jgi:hypothetical protein
VTTVCLASKCLPGNLGYGGHVWVYLNWALGCREAGARVVLLETLLPGASDAEAIEALDRFAGYRAAVGLEADVALLRYDAATSRYVPVEAAFAGRTRPFSAVASEADVFLDLLYDVPADLLARFRRTALVDIDPGLLQHWVTAGQMRVTPHDVHFTIGETVGRPGSCVPDLGFTWVHTPPPVSLEAWRPALAAADAPYTSVSGWWGDWEREADGEVYNNEKRTSYLAFCDLPAHVAPRLELALHLPPGADGDVPRLEAAGWSVRDAREVSDTPTRYRDYIAGSRAEFGCAKPSCLRHPTAWISDRTLCYLASGKPAVVQDTGPSGFLPRAGGLWRFQTLAEAARAISEIEADYDGQSRLARTLAETHFDARAVLRRVIERAI